MPSRLSSLLVRDGLIGVKRMEAAFQRQVIHGGALDTVLLEMKLVPEQRLLQYLSLATGLPAADHGDTSVLSADAIALCSQSLADQYRVVPLTQEEGALRVLVCDPIDLSELEELASELNTPLQPLVVPEYRFHVTRAQTFGDEPEERFRTLAEAAKSAGAPAPVGKSQTVIVEAVAPEGTERVVVNVPPVDSDAQEGVPTENASTETVRTESAPAESSETRQDDSEGSLVARAHAAAQEYGRTSSQTTTMEISTDALARRLKETERQRISEAKRRSGVGSTDDALSAVSPDNVHTDIVEADTAASKSDSVPVAPGASRPEPAMTGSAQPVDDVVTKRIVSTRRSSQPGISGLPAGGAARYRPRTSPPDISVSPMNVAEAKAALAEATHRDAIFEILLRAIRSRATYAALLTIQGSAAIGRVAIAGTQVDPAIVDVLIPLDAASSFTKAIGTSAPYIGPVATGDAEIDDMLSRMGGIVPPSALLMPVALRNRVVALCVAHKGVQPISITEVSELLPLSGAAADALSRLIRQNKSSPIKNPAKPSPPVEPSDSTPTARHKKDASWVSAMHSDPEIRIEAAADADPIDRVLDEIESAHGEPAASAITEALGRTKETLHALKARFPGRLAVDRYELGGRTVRASRHGPLIDLVIKLGPAASSLLIERMDDTNKEIRYYATVCAAQLRPLSALGPLVARLFDSDHGVRGAAIRGLLGYTSADLERNLHYLRQQLHSEDPLRVRAAAEATAKLADTKSIPDLLDACARNDQGSEHARRALNEITKQDFGSNVRKWRSWWSKNKSRHRVGWLLDGLAHKDASNRRSAADELRHVTGESFGYLYDGSKKEREASRKRWLQWWEETGRRKFTREGPDERVRSTAVLPVRERE